MQVLPQTLLKFDFLEKIESCKNSKLTNWNNGFRALCINDKSSDLVSHFQNGADLSDRTAGSRAAGQKPAPGRWVSAPAAHWNKYFSSGPRPLKIGWKGGPGRGPAPVKSWALWSQNSGSHSQTRVDFWPPQFTADTKKKLTTRNNGLRALSFN